MEKSISLPTPDNHIIYGTLNSKNKSEKLIIFVHGLGGNQARRIIYNGAKFLIKKGFDTFRRNLYNSSMEKARELRTVSISDNANDIETIVKYFKKTYKKIFIIGHSLGGLTILRTNSKNITSAVLWDGSLDPYDRKEKYTFNKELNCYIGKGGIEILVSKNLIKERLEDKTKLLKKYTIPTKIICAGEGRLKNQWKKAIPILKSTYEYKEIKNASHSFDEEGVEEKLFEETLKWFIG